MTTTETPSSSSASGWSETADEWLQRFRRKIYRSSAPIDPSSAAWAFVETKEEESNSSTISSGGTGISFVDLVLKKHYQQQQQQQQQDLQKSLPIIDILGDKQSGKTWTLLSLAARFVVATRLSAFGGSSGSATAATTTTTTLDSLPQVIILDSNYNITASKLAYTVRATLLRQYTSADIQHDQFLADMESCLARIHIAVASDTLEWVPILETLRYKLASRTEHPTLLLWDDFLAAPSEDVARAEVIRQLVRLLQDGCVFLVTTSSKHRRHEWSRYVTHRIRLEREADKYFATIGEDRVPYSLSLSGVLV